MLSIAENCLLLLQEEAVSVIFAAGSKTGRVGPGGQRLPARSAAAEGDGGARSSTRNSFKCSKCHRVGCNRPPPTVHNLSSHAPQNDMGPPPGMLPPGEDTSVCSIGVMAHA